ncbi:nucleotide-binding protein [Staphylococcus xylosus]|uniref:nucleotide-binding protein n=1 Tax=Staphylococcus xylosus TaxID=1288 RepID=UPI002DB7EEA7|nr:nucleotide-binding protein [Staphylococcus xylosus]MEB6276520.1 nucleotide-binding protein [Staphylococcus xylosus]
MNNQEKLQKLNSIKETIKSISYSNKEKLNVEQTKLTRFVEKRIDSPNFFLNQIKNIRYTPAILNSSSTNYIESWESGKHQLISILDSVIDDLEDDLEDDLNSNTNYHSGNHTITNSKSSIFIIHGHDNEMKSEVARYIEKLKLTPIILQEHINNGDTIIEKFERLSNQASFAIALFSDDDDINGKKRARQNVVLEYGYFIAKLGRKNTMLLKKGEIEIPSDISGVLYEDYTTNSWKTPLAQALKESGFNIDMNNVL